MQANSRAIEKIQNGVNISSSSVIHQMSKMKDRCDGYENAENGDGYTDIYKINGPSTSVKIHQNLSGATSVTSGLSMARRRPEIDSRQWR